MSTPKTGKGGPSKRQPKTKIALAAAASAASNLRPNKLHRTYSNREPRMVICKIDFNNFNQAMEKLWDDVFEGNASLLSIYDKQTLLAIHDVGTFIGLTLAVGEGYNIKETDLKIATTTMKTLKTTANNMLDAIYEARTNPNLVFKELLKDRTKYFEKYHLDFSRNIEASGAGYANTNDQCVFTKGYLKLLSAYAPSKQQQSQKTTKRECGYCGYYDDEDKCHYTCDHGLEIANMLVIMNTLSTCSPGLSFVNDIMEDLYVWTCPICNSLKVYFQLEQKVENPHKNTHYSNDRIQCSQFLNLDASMVANVNEDSVKQFAHFIKHDRRSHSHYTWKPSSVCLKQRFEFVQTLDTTVLETKLMGIFNKMATAITERLQKKHDLGTTLALYFQMMQFSPYETKSRKQEVPLEPIIEYAQDREIEIFVGGKPKKHNKKQRSYIKYSPKQRKQTKKRKHYKTRKHR